MKIACIDLETTGLDKTKDTIIEVAIAVFESETFEVIEKYETLINPGIPIPAINSSITNIYDQDVRDKPKWSEVEQKVGSLIWDLPILGQNIGFDIGFFQTHWIDLSDNSVLDTFSLAGFLVFWQKSLSLEYLCKYFEIEFEWAHRAMNDVLWTILVFQKLIKMIQQKPTKEASLIKYILSNTNDIGLNFIVKECLWDIETIYKDEAISHIVQSFPKKITQKKRSKSNVELPKLSIPANFDWLEFRTNQETMRIVVEQTLNNHEMSVIEAPTWVWKTFAYLLPSIEHALSTWEQVFVSTSTKALQDQIYYKDLQFLKEKLDVDFSYTKLKWKNNYVSLSSFLSLVQEHEVYEKQLSFFILKIALWLGVTQNGELDELDYYWSDYGFLYQITADDFYTSSQDNPYYEQEFIVRARKQARNVHIVVINNALLFQDIDSDNSILWKVENLVLDEAHNLEDVLTDALKKTTSLSDIQKALQSLVTKLKKEQIPTQSFQHEADTLVFELGLVFDYFKLYIFRKNKADAKYKQTLIKQDFFDQELKEHQNLWFETHTHFSDYLELLHDLPEKKYALISREVLILERAHDIFQKLLASDASKNYICIANIVQETQVTLEYSYLSAWDYLEKNLWSKLQSCVITSATLRTSNSYDYIQKSLALQNFEFTTLKTDFNYKKQALLFVPNDIGNIKNNSPQTISFLRQLFLTSWWSVLVLFTAFAMIQEVYTKLENDMKQAWIQLYAQSIGWGKQKLLDLYMQNAENWVLLWTNTFWEWIDIPWEKLKYLVIHKIPFAVPTDPVFQARSILYKDPFLDYSVPKSILKLKQGFGRLIRSKADQWIVIFLDNRIYQTKWGWEFYSAFPEDIPKRIDSSQAFLSLLEQKKS